LQIEFLLVGIDVVHDGEFAHPPQQPAGDAGGRLGAKSVSLCIANAAIP
jgi:hypothetical protein